MSDLTLIIQRVENGDPRAAEELLPLVYNELRSLATAKMARESVGHTLQPTALVHEAWLRLTNGAVTHWQDRAHFFHTAAEAMRRILIDKARERAAQKRGAGAEHVSLQDFDSPMIADDTSLLRLDEALEKLALQDADSARLVKLRFFTGLNIEEAAQILGVSERTAKRYWTFARAWLYEELRK
jgi:RNA polymerase sigma factor (TIGR02999 family)